MFVQLWFSSRFISSKKKDGSWYLHCWPEPYLVFRNNFTAEIFWSTIGISKTTYHILLIFRNCPATETLEQNISISNSYRLSSILNGGCRAGRTFWISEEYIAARFGFVFLNFFDFKVRKLRQQPEHRTHPHTLVHQNVLGCNCINVLILQKRVLVYCNALVCVL